MEVSKSHCPESGGLKSPALSLFTVYHLWVHPDPLPTFLQFCLFFIPFPVRQDRSDEQLDGWQVVLTLQSSLSTGVKNVSTPDTPRQFWNESKRHMEDDDSFEKQRGQIRVNEDVSTEPLDLDPRMFSSSDIFVVLMEQLYKGNCSVVLKCYLPFISTSYNTIKKIPNYPFKFWPKIYFQTKVHHQLKLQTLELRSSSLSIKHLDICSFSFSIFQTYGSTLPYITTGDSK